MPVGQSWSNFTCSVIGHGGEVALGFEVCLVKTVVTMATNSSHWLIMGNIVRMIASLFFYRSASNLQVTSTGIKCRGSLIFGQIQLLTLELHALELEKIAHILIMGKCCLDDNAFIFYPILIILCRWPGQAWNVGEGRIGPYWSIDFGVMCPWGGGRVVRRCCVSYITGASNWYWLTVGQGLLSL